MSPPLNPFFFLPSVFCVQVPEFESLSSQSTPYLLDLILSVALFSPYTRRRMTLQSLPLILTSHLSVYPILLFRVLSLKDKDTTFIFQKHPSILLVVHCHCTMAEEEKPGWVRWVKARVITCPQLFREVLDNACCTSVLSPFTLNRVTVRRINYLITFVKAHV